MKKNPWYGIISPFLLLDRLQNVQDLPDVAILGLQERGQPASLVGEAHVGHGLKRNLDPGVSVSHLSLGWCDLSLRSRGRGCLRLGEVGVQRALVLGDLLWVLDSLLLGILFVRDHSPVPLIIRWGGGLLSRLRLNLIGLLVSLLLLLLSSSLLGGRAGGG